VCPKPVKTGSFCTILVAKIIVLADEDKTLKKAAVALQNPAKMGQALTTAPINTRRLKTG
jgi:hypothetical protein